MAVLSIFVFRSHYPLCPRPYRCWGYAVTPALYIVLPLFILSNMFVNQLREALIGVGFIGLGTAIYCLAFRGAKHLPLVPAGYLLSEPPPATEPETRFSARPD